MRWVLLTTSVSFTSIVPAGNCNGSLESHCEMSDSPSNWPKPSKFVQVLVLATCLLSLLLVLYNIYGPDTDGT